MGLKNKIEPIYRCAAGRAPLCPWSSAFRNLHPATWSVRPPQMDIAIVRECNDRHLLRFGGKHDFWFPLSMIPSEELWSEYLVTSWDHRINAHYYLRFGVKLETDDIVVDCGACEGFFTRQALDAGVSKVICIEPNPEMAACLKKSFELEISQGRVIIESIALGSLTGQASFDCSPGDAFSGHFSDSGTLVPITTLDRLCAEHGEPTMIKMDLEGSEYEALRGGAEFLRKQKPKLAITTYHYPWDHPVVSGLIKGAGYRNIKVSAATMRGGNVPRPVMLHAW